MTRDGPLIYDIDGTVTARAEEKSCYINYQSLQTVCTGVPLIFVGSNALLVYLGGEGLEILKERKL